MASPPQAPVPTGPVAVVPGLLCPFCGQHPNQIRPPFIGAGAGHFYAACPSCQRLALFDYDAGVVKSTQPSMAFKFESRLLLSRDRHLRRMGELMREGIDAAYLQKWSAAATLFRMVGEAFTQKKLLGHKHAPRFTKGKRKGKLDLHKPLGSLLEHLAGVKAAVCAKLGIKAGALKRVVSALHYLRRIGNTAVHLYVKPSDRVLPNSLSVDVARQKIESIFSEVYAW